MAVQIMVELPETLAGIYENGTESERQRVQWIVEAVLKVSFSADKPTLAEVMDRMSAEAAARGLTPEILEEILNSDDDE